MIKTPKDLIGKKVMITDHQRNSVSIVSMLLSNQVTMDQVTTVPHSFNLEDLITQKVDAYAAYQSNEPYILQQQDINYTILDPKLYTYSFPKSVNSQ